MPEESLFVEKTVESGGTVKDENCLDNLTIPETIEEPLKVNDLEPSPEVTIVTGNESEEYVELSVETGEDDAKKNEEVVRTLLNELINCIVFKNEMNLPEEIEDDKDQEEEIEVIESVPVEAKKNIIDVDLIEKLDDEEDIVYQRKAPSPIVLIPTVNILTIYSFSSFNLKILHFEASSNLIFFFPRQK